MAERYEPEQQIFSCAVGFPVGRGGCYTIAQLKTTLIGMMMSRELERRDGLFSDRAFRATAQTGLRLGGRYVNKTTLGKYANDSLLKR
jgi:hypothetical protein